jgi:ribose/xylose/arabinose/galactoside ABC-type transport system permease subunit
MSRQNASMAALVMFFVWLCVVFVGLLAGGLGVASELTTALVAAFGPEWGSVAAFVVTILGAVIVPMEVIHRITRGAMTPADRRDAEAIDREVHSRSFSWSLFQVSVCALVVIVAAIALGWVR